MFKRILSLLFLGLIIFLVMGIVQFFTEFFGTGPILPLALFVTAGVYLGYKWGSKKNK